MWPTSFPLGALQRCRGCDHPRPKYTGGYASLRSTLGTMLSMAKFTGCEVCYILSDGILKFLADGCCGLSREDVDEVQIAFNLAGSRRSLEITLINTPVTLSYFISKSTPWLEKTLPDVPVGNAVPRSTSSDESLHWAMQQIQSCKQSHKDCNNLSDATLPTRVLNVSSDSGVRLYESQGETAEYIALSHCWGRKTFLCTVSDNLDAHKTDIVWSELPPSFQDAVTLTRKLGVRYLWIDSLCIIQDDEDDWRREAARMASVYQNATLVISAAKSDSAYGGLYADLPAKHKTHTVTFCPGSTYADATPDDNDDSDNNTDTDNFGHHQQGSPDTERVHVRHALTHTHRLLLPHHAPSTTLLPLFARGWILQERLLSRRILHLGPEELSFECRGGGGQSATCQCTATTPPTAPSSSSTSTNATQQDKVGEKSSSGEEQHHWPSWYTHLLNRTSQPKHYYSLSTWQGMREAGEEVEVQTAWRRLVEDYTRLRLTFDRDIFPAISGMAQQMAVVRPGERYLAGLWGKSLLVGDLLWHVQPLPWDADAVDGEEGGGVGEGGEGGIGGERVEGAEKTWRWMDRPVQWRAPSWSWAAVTAPVEFLNVQDGVQSECELVEVRCETVGPDTMGELKEGGSYLVLKGHLIPAQLRLKEVKDTPKPFNMADLDIMEGHVRNFHVDDDCKSLVAAVGGAAKVYCLVLGRKLPRKEVLCVVLARVSQSNSESATTADQGVDKGVVCLYRRVGLLEVNGGPAGPVPWDWLHKLLGKGEDAVVKIV